MPSTNIDWMKMTVRRMKDCVCTGCGTEFRRRADKVASSNIYCSVLCCNRSRSGIVFSAWEGILHTGDLQSNFLDGYHASLDGRIFRLYDFGWRELPQYNTNGYLTFRVGRATWRAHRAVAMAYCPNPEGKPHVNHMDCDKKNNHASNLEWVTPMENMHHAFRMGRMTSRFGHIYGIGKDGSGVFLRCAEDARKIGFIPQNITAALNGHRRSAAGYFWHRADDLQTC